MPTLHVAKEIVRAGAAAYSFGSGRPVAQSDLHATLAFLGNVPETGLPALASFASLQRCREFHLVFDRVEFWTEAAAIVMTMRLVPSPLDEFWRRFHVGLSLPARETFRPHVTLMRKVSQGPVEQAIPVVYWTPRSFSLVRSDTGGSQSAYTVLDTWPLLYEP